MRRSFLRAGIALVSLTLSLLFCEGILRVLGYPEDIWYPWVEDEELGYRWSPNITQHYDHPEAGMWLKTNSHGYRDDEVRPKRDFRIVLLGDSFAAGHGVEVEDSCATLLEEQLGVEVVNVSMSGHGLIHHLHRVRSQEFKQLDPDLVVLMLYLGNDLTQNQAWLSVRGNRLLRKEGPFTKPVPPRAKLLNLLYRLVYQEEKNTREEWKPWERDSSICSRPLTREGEVMYEESGELLEELEANLDCDYFPVFFGHRFMLESRSLDAANSSKTDWLTAERRMESFFESRGQAFLNLNPDLAEAHGKRSLHYRTDPHWNEEGHRVVASLLVPALKKRLDGSVSTTPLQN